ncbi:MAG: DNA polymerase III subunit gamma/tau [Tannerella sp.]|jgi:DNA polymerase-3 subunit gamma/tau|nr:DNA polymerase III subunit gamma/tau [Tannerella sp.]
MENYIVSARKYRPSTFKSVVGQKSLTTTLKNAIRSGKLAHAYLFCGPRGVGKTSCARIFAKTINCINPSSDGEACNECESCMSFNEQRSLNIHELDAASNNSVDDIRSLTEQVRIPPQLGKYKVYIIDEVHMLSAQAFNAFLKTLEEPPHHAIFILATTEKQKILPTILSRCQTYDFTRITIEDIVEHLQYVASQENITTEAEALNVIAQKADGGMRDALSIFDQIASFTSGNITYNAVIENLNVLDYDYYFRITEAILNSDVRACLLILNQIIEKGFDGQNIISGLAIHLRDLLVCKDESTIVLFEFSASIRERYINQAKQCPDKLLFRAIEIANQCDLNYRNSRNKRLLLELTLIQLCQLTDSPATEDDKKKILIKAIQPGGNETAAKTETTEKIKAKPPVVTKPAETTPVPPVVHSTALKDLIKDDSAKTAPSVKLIEANDNFSQEDLKKFWVEYAESLTTVEQTHLKNTLLSCNPTLIDGFTYEIAIDNPYQKNEIAEIYPEIITFLRHKLNNSHLEIDVRLKEKEETTMPYTASEKYDYLANKNPALEKLKNTFDLTLE